MTTPPHPSPLVERVAQAIGPAGSWRSPKNMARALAAVRVVVEAAAEIADGHAGMYEVPSQAASDCCCDAALLIAADILRLLPSEPEA